MKVAEARKTSFSSLAAPSESTRKSVSDSADFGKTLSSQSEKRLLARRLRNEVALNPDQSIGTLTTKAVRGGALALASHGVFLALQIGQLVILSRLLTPDDFGVVGMAMAVTGFIRLFQDMGLSSATIQRRAIDQCFISALFFLNVAVGIGLMVICWLVAPVAGWFFEDDRVVMVIATLALNIPLIALRAQHCALLSRRMEYLKLSLGQIISNAVGTTTTCLLAWHTDLRYWSIVVGQLTTGVVDLLFFWAASRWTPSIPLRGEGLRSAVGFGVRVMLSNFLGWMWKQSDNVLIGWRWGSVELGYYTRAYSILLMPLMLVGGPVASVVIPALSRLQDDRDKWATLFRRTVRTVTAMSALFAALLFVNADFIIDLALGPGWEQSQVIFSALALSILPSIAWEQARIVFLSLGRSDIMLRYSMIAGPLHLLAFIAGLPYGPIGVAWALVAISWVLAVPILIISAKTASISSLCLIIDVLPPVAGFGAATFAIPLLSDFEATALMRALYIGATASIMFVLGTAAVAVFCRSWRNDLTYGVGRLLEMMKVRTA